MCLFSKLILNPKYKPNKKNGYNPPIVMDERVRYVPIGCQECIECRKQKARGWQLRLLEEVKERKNGKFITLTFSNESIKKIYESPKTKNWQGCEGLTGYELDNEIATRGMRLFLERWRKKYKKSLRHWTVTELGHKGTENIHIHGIVWTDESIEEIAKIWGYGYIWPKEKSEIKNNYVSARTVNYIIKYVTKKDWKHSYYKSIVLTSPGIGKRYTNTYNSQLNKFKGKETIETYKSDNGYKISMPIYWRNKIYNDEEREKLWLQRLDKEERWVMGERIKASENQNEYYKLVCYYRKINQQLGYGSDEKDENRMIYERNRRYIMQQTRINKAREKEGG